MILAGLITGCERQEEPENENNHAHIQSYLDRTNASPAKTFEHRLDTKLRTTPAKTGSCGYRIALVGDSLTANTYAPHLRKLCGSKTKIMDNDGDPSTSYRTGGEDHYAAWSRRTGEMFENFDKVLDDGPETVVIIGGCNDIISSRVNSDQIISNIENMIKLAHKRHIPVVTATIPPFRNSQMRKRYNRRGNNLGNIIVENILDVNDWMYSDDNPAEAVAYIHRLLEDPEERSAANRKLYARDLIHPNRQGFKLIAREVYEAIISIERD